MPYKWLNSMVYGRYNKVVHGDYNGYSWFINQQTSLGGPILYPLVIKRFAFKNCQFSSDFLPMQDGDFPVRKLLVYERVNYWCCQMSFFLVDYEHW